MDKPKVTPKDFFLWVGAMVALYVSVFSLVSLLFDYINYAYPDVLNTYIDPYSSSMRYEIASLIVLFPVFMFLMRLIRGDIERDAMKKDIWVRRWVLFLTLFVAGATIVIDLIMLINTFLGGDLTTRFGLKVLVVFLIAGGGFLHFLADLRGYWAIYPKRAQMVGWGTGVLILVSVVAGFFIIGSPGQMRLFRFDDQKVNDLTMLQYQIVNYWQQKERLPLALSDLEDPISGFAVPTDPQTEGSYRYEKTGALSFKLCADFNADSREDSRARVVAVPIGVDGMVGKGLETEAWQHGVGETCFERTIDPERYPPFKKQ
ncbi:hypothetical protein A3F27_00320 [Candidatus Kaiserbacteria bacterium RIFCSPHIGHO2_12_FULL_53_13]|uniref:DUF5671 domain-containing protein n=1 Tax=Candidatus Kaiserbacteria bacterium RIFCSPHIGHO2_12_FULL_53_13 TaxID=1798502 RepID=A0A1F6E771_9BACT|nr:MAG: hypothetical protein A3F27_00320 [Candidatus Kaiserbacteria bacterium RIFCSPHIGHO2_12_FULL_53_13]OGG74740.1 MAG: hypothetical protein A3A37_01600 [Candidatus Kaiserbacteria bacterium RIFCSPLOWO2_01_FULL_52_36]